MIRLFFISFVLLFSSCTSGLMETEAPKNLLSKEKMIEIMKELVELESHIQSTYPSVAEYNKTMINSSELLFKKLSVKEEDFEASMDYYGTHQEQMKEIYNEVLDQLNSELGELQSTKD